MSLQEQIDQVRQELELRSQLVNELNYFKRKTLERKIRELQKQSKKPNVEQPNQLPLL